jgi:hypothetical protein
MGYFDLIGQGAAGARRRRQPTEPPPFVPSGPSGDPGSGQETSYYGAPSAADSPPTAAPDSFMPAGGVPAGMTAEGLQGMIGGGAGDDGAAAGQVADAENPGDAGAGGGSRDYGPLLRKIGRAAAGGLGGLQKSRQAQAPVGGYYAPSDTGDRLAAALMAVRSQNAMPRIR